jgi:hypothetical protein
MRFVTPTASLQCSEPLAGSGEAVDKLTSAHTRILTALDVGEPPRSAHLTPACPLATDDRHDA